VVDLFNVAWDRLEKSHVEQFLDDAGDEGVTWEAKGAGPSSGPHRDSLGKAACGFANQIGGYLIVGATRSDGKWRLDGIPRPAEEPRLWVAQILEGLQPAPRFEVSDLFEMGDGRVAMVARVEPVAAPPCMTAQGRIYERVSGATVEVKDPGLLDRLIRRGDHARLRAEQFAGRAAERAIDLPDWISERSVSICVGLASIGRETDDISSRLFTESMYDLLTERVWDLHGQTQPQGVSVRPTQDSYLALIDSQMNHHWDDGNAVIGVIRSSHFIQANWDDSVAAGLWFADDFDPSMRNPEALIVRFWTQAAEITQRLGGYGPAFLSVRVVVAKSGKEEVVGQEVRIAGRPPPNGTVYARLPALTTMGRLLDVAEPSELVIQSLGRELQRAGGLRADEPS
jgi:Putative DNA-binding domain